MPQMGGVTMLSGLIKLRPIVLGVGIFILALSQLYGHKYYSNRPPREYGDKSPDETMNLYITVFFAFLGAMMIGYAVYGMG